MAGEEEPAMTPIVSTVEIDRPPEAIFFYVTDPSKFPEWQQGVVRGGMDSDPVHVGSRCTTVRKVGGSEREVTTEITEFDPPRRWADHGIEGPIRAIVSVSVEPLEQQARSRLTIELDFEGHGIGRLLVPLMVRRQAKREMPHNMRRLKERLGSGV
jgi:uncharacterized protein YndB with AHSA1/START domain